MRFYESLRTFTKVDESWWKLTKVDKSWRKLTKVDESYDIPWYFLVQLLTFVPFHSIAMYYWHFVILYRDEQNFSVCYRTISPLGNIGKYFAIVKWKVIFPVSQILTCLCFFEAKWLKLWYQFFSWIIPMCYDTISDTENGIPKLHRTSNPLQGIVS